MKKILGILGGMGPFATSNFFYNILKLTKAEKDWDHLRIIIDNNTDIPSRTRCILYNEKSPTNQMKDACFSLMRFGCDYIAVPCNSAHYFYEDVVKNTNIPWINMIEVVSEKLRKFKNILVLGGYVTIVKNIYDKYLDNVSYLLDNNLVYEIIEDVKKNSINNERLFKLYDEINKIEVDCVLLACTELPIAIQKKYINYEVYDGNEIYIKKLINICGGTIKNE